MRRVKFGAVVVLAVVMVAPLLAQEAKGAAVVPARQPAVYRLQFVYSEFQDGKKVNSRSYEMLAREGEVNRLRAGSRVPVSTGPGTTNFQYLDVGMDIDCRIKEMEGYVDLHIVADSSNFTTPEAQKDAAHVVIQQMRSQVNTLVTPGKPTLVSSMDDPSSTRRFELQVTATKVR